MFVKFNKQQLYTIAEGDPQLKYKENPETEFKNNNGQLKLLTSELLLLTYYRKDETDVIYAGAAPGYHIRVLLKRFPELHFHLYDPRSFDKKLY